MKHTFLFLFVGLTLFSACKKDDPVIQEVETQKISNLYAPADVRDHQTGEIIEENPFVYFSFAENGVVTQSDSWDIAFKGTLIITNSGISGTGQAKATVVESTFADLKTAPEDSELETDSATGFAIPNGSDNGWYHYDPSTHNITPIAGRIIVVKTNDGKYAKMEILSYYKGAPAQPSGDDAYLTFNYALQENGSRDF